MGKDGQSSQVGFGVRWIRGEGLYSEAKIPGKVSKNSCQYDSKSKAIRVVRVIARHVFAGA